MRTRSINKSILLMCMACLLVSACVNEAVVPTQPAHTSTVAATATALPTATATALPEGFVEYITQSGDTLPVIAAHFGVEATDIQGAEALHASAIVDPGIPLLVKDVAGVTTPADILFPDAAIVFSPTAIDFDVQVFADEQGGHLAKHTELMTRGTTLASEVITQLALDYSINPCILLALLEVESGWVSGIPEGEEAAHYPYGHIHKNKIGIYQQTGWAVRQLSLGYYGWRAGTLTELTFIDGSTLRLAPSLNAGTVAVLNFFAQIHTLDEWEELVYGENGISTVYENLFGDPWERALGLNPLFPAGMAQPEMNLPFPPNEKWNYTCGPHYSHSAYFRNKEEGPLAALDFAPPLDGPGCGNSTHYATAAAPGRVVRVGNGVVVLDLDKDGYEQTGWVLIYMHIANSDRVGLDAFLETDDLVGHPSCEGGSSSGIHIHIMRKYNGEWILADGGLTFTLSGYQAAVGEEYCQGTLENDERIISAFPWGNYLTALYRPESNPEYLHTPTPSP